MESESTQRFYFIANNLSLDLVNTLVVDGNGQPLELLRSFDDLIDWALAAEIISPEQASTARDRTDADEQKLIFKLALNLRQELKEMAQALDAGKAVPPTVIRGINDVLARKSGHFEVTATADAGYKTKFRVDDDDVSDLLLPVAEGAAWLLCNGDLRLVRKCQNPDCVLYFYDISKRHGRRWCSMSVCGNRAKAASFYERRRSGKASS